MLSPVLFCFYVNDLFKVLKTTKNGCTIGPYYAGVYGYADDLFLLCPSRGGIQEMLDKTEEYALEHKISFSTNPDPKKRKTKGIVFRNPNCKMTREPENLRLYGDLLPWENGAKYLGNRITNIINGLLEDTTAKRAQYIERNCELMQEFWFAHPALKCKLNRIYNSSFPGSVLWDLTSDAVNSIINSWSTSIRLMWDLPRWSHKIFIEALGGMHAKTIYQIYKFNYERKKGSTNIATRNDQTQYKHYNCKEYEINIK